MERLVTILDDHGRFWDTEQLAPGWWNAQVGSYRTETRRRICGEGYAAVVALDRIDDRRAGPELERTCRRWEAIRFENPQIVESCRATFEAIRETRPLINL